MCDTSKPQRIDGRPVIHSVLDVTSGRHDCCTPGGRFILRGRGFGLVEEPSLDEGVYVHGSGAVLQRVARYESWHDKEIHGYWPTSVAGPVWVFVETTGPLTETQSAVHRSPVLPAQRIPG